MIHPHISKEISSLENWALPHHNIGGSLDYFSIRLEKSLPQSHEPQLRKTEREKAFKAWPGEKDATSHLGLLSQTCP